MNKRLIGVAAAVVLGIIGALIVVTYVQGADRRAVAASQPISVIVVQQAVPAGTPADQLAKLVTAKDVPQSAVAEGAVVNLADVTGKVTAVALVPGQQLLTSLMVDPKSQRTSGKVPVPAGLQEVSVLLEARRALGGYVTAGDTVGIFITFDNGPKPGGNSTNETLHKVLVTSVQGAPDPAKVSQDSASSPVAGGNIMVTFAVDTPTATKIVYASEFGRIWLSREPATASEQGSGPITIDGIYK